MRLWLAWVAHASASAALAAEIEAGACPDAATGAELESHLAVAEAAYAALDPVSYEAGLDAASATLRCLGEVIPTPVAAHYHRLEALRQYAVPDEEAVTHALRAARVLEPDSPHPDDLLPPDHELRALFDRLSPTEPGGASIPPPATGLMYFDGRLSELRPTARATVFQLVVDTRPTHTTYLYPQDPLPKYPMRGALGTRSTARARGPARVILWTVAGAALAGSAAAYGAAWSANARFHDQTTTLTETELRSLQRHTWTLSGLAVGLVAVGAGTGVGGVVVR